LIESVAESLKKVPRFIQERMVSHCQKADPAYGQGVAKRLGLSVR
jgi:catalase